MNAELQKAYRTAASYMAAGNPDAARNALLPFADKDTDGGFTAMRIVNMLDHDMRGAACVALFTAMTGKVEL